MFPLCSLKFSTGSHQIHNTFLKFSMCSPRVFPIASRFNPICFAQSPPLLTYIGGSKDRHSVFQSNLLFWEILHSFNSFWRRVNQNNSLQKKKSWTCESPPTNWYNHITFINTINLFYNHTRFKATLDKGSRSRQIKLWFILHSINLEGKPINPDPKK
jgi:hypothetical protein